MSAMFPLCLAAPVAESEHLSTPWNTMLGRPRYTLTIAGALAASKTISHCLLGDSSDGEGFLSGQRDHLPVHTAECLSCS